MPIFIENRRKSKDFIHNKYVNPIILDLTSNSSSIYVKFSPFYPHRNILVPFSDNIYANSVEGIWQGLKVFENSGIDISKFNIDNMRGIKRNDKRFGNILGHQKGVNGNELLDYITAKKEIYVPAYLWILNRYMQEEVSKIRELSVSENVVFLDYNTDSELFSPIRPISHAFVCKLYIENNIV